MTEQTSDIQWYIARDDQQHGPLTNAEIKLFVDGRHLLETDLVWRAGFPDWKPAFEVFPPTDSPAKESKPEASQKTPTEQPSQSASKNSDATAAGQQGNVSEKSGTSKQALKPSGKSNTGVDAKVSSGDTAASKGQKNPVTAGSSASPNEAVVATSETNGSPAGPSSVANGASINTPSTDQGLPQNQSSAADYNYSPPPSGAGRRFAIAAGILGLVGGGGWYAINTNPQIADFARAALNIPQAEQSDSDDSSTTNTDDVQVVKAPDTPAGAPPPEETAEATTSTTTGVNTTTAAVDSTPDPQPDPQPAPQESEQQPAAPPTPPEQQAEPAAQEPTPQTENVEIAAVATPPEPPPAREAEIDPHYKNSPLWVVVREQFPEWYEKRMNEMKQLSAEKPKGEITQIAMKWLVGLRRENAAAALAASSPKLRSIAKTFLVNLQTLKSHSTEACFSFISKGETSPAVISLIQDGESAKTMEAQSTAVFQAIADGRKSPQKRERPKKPDYDVLAAELGQLGWSQSDLQLFANPTALARAAPERVCQMVQDWFTAHIAIKDEAVQDRLLYETLRPVIAG